jgi:deoxyribonuclease-4
MKLGAHMSITGGLHKACERGQATSCNVIQIFTKNEKQWYAPPLSNLQRKRFKEAMKSFKIRAAYAHDTYLINLASPDRRLWRRSVEAFAQEMRRAEWLGLPYLITHPGSHRGSGERQGLKNIIRAINLLLSTNNYRLKILLETTAGQGNTLGWRFEHLRDILEGSIDPQRLGVCVDTCHIFASGYDIRIRKAYEDTFDHFARVIGLDKICLFHLNDSKAGLGSRIDRHEHIGRGRIGLDAFGFLMRDPRFKQIPMIIETPKSWPKDDEMDRRNLAILRELADG